MNYVAPTQESIDAIRVGEWRVEEGTAKQSPRRLRVTGFRVGTDRFHNGARLVEFVFENGTPGAWPDTYIAKWCPPEPR